VSLVRSSANADDTRLNLIELQSIGFIFDENEPRLPRARGSVLFLLALVADEPMLQSASTEIMVPVLTQSPIRVSSDPVKSALANWHGSTLFHEDDGR
jgi:hypothetical protein